MITQLYTFSPSSYVVSDEWNGNFNILYKTSYEHSEAITDAYNVLAFPYSDLTGVFNAVKSQYNSNFIRGSSVTVSVEQEYYKTLASAENLVITINPGMDGEARILIQLQENRSLLPFSINYSGSKIIDYGFYDYNYFRAGYYYIMIYEANNIAQIKLIWTGA